ncbi:MAG TPA: hypothetical protein PK970_08915 [Hyphomicrobiaceae bacterium]|nr:hypothetical protein [Hyphomicrobiaceae bacterium]
MDEHGNRISKGTAFVVAVAAVIAGYVPAVALWAGAMDRLRPRMHAEEAMGRGLEALFIGGPIGAVIFALLAGWVSYRYGRGAMTVVVVLVAAGAVASIVGTGLVSLR